MREEIIVPTLIKLCNFSILKKLLIKLIAIAWNKVFIKFVLKCKLLFVCWLYRKLILIRQLLMWPFLL
jgi:hypothetical protein